MQWLIDLVIEYLEEHGYTHTHFVDRGDPAAVDFLKANLTTNGAWQEMRLDGIVPSAAKAVLFTLTLVNSATAKSATFRKFANTNAANVSVDATIVANLSTSGDYICPIGTDGKLGYNFTNIGWLYISFTVKGWWL